MRSVILGFSNDRTVAKVAWTVSRVKNYSQSIKDSDDKMSYIEVDSNIISAGVIRSQWKGFLSLLNADLS